MNLSRLAHARKARGLSQSEVASRARTSLATIQNIEAGRANPSLETVERIFKILGLRLVIQDAPPAWDRLISLGVPLVANDSVSIRPDRELLRVELSKLSADSIDTITDTREKSALVSWLKALHDHYPLFWNRFAHHLDAWLKAQEFSAAEIKIGRAHV